MNQYHGSFYSGEQAMFAPPPKSPFWPNTVVGQQFAVPLKAAEFTIYKRAAAAFCDRVLRTDASAPFAAAEKAAQKHGPGQYVVQSRHGVWFFDVKATLKSGWNVTDINDHRP